MDRAGRVIAAQIDKNSGFPLLDEEVSALIQRAQSLPAPPPEAPCVALIVENGRTPRGFVSGTGF